jgi:hypothetical protein
VFFFACWILGFRRKIAVFFVDSLVRLSSWWWLTDKCSTATHQCSDLEFFRTHYHILLSDGRGSLQAICNCLMYSKRELCCCRRSVLVSSLMWFSRFFCCMCILCRGNAFSALLPRNFALLFRHSGFVSQYILNVNIFRLGKYFNYDFNGWNVEFPLDDMRKEAVTEDLVKINAYKVWIHSTIFWGSKVNFRNIMRFWRWP